MKFNHLLRNNDGEDLMMIGLDAMLDSTDAVEEFVSILFTNFFLKLW